MTNSTRNALEKRKIQINDILLQFLIKKDIKSSDAKIHEKRWSGITAKYSDSDLTNRKWTCGQCQVYDQDNERSLSFNSGQNPWKRTKENRKGFEENLDS